MNLLHHLSALNQSFEKYSKLCAITENGMEFSYQQLSERANQIAAYLFSHLEPNFNSNQKLPVIAICLPRGFNSIATMLAAWKLNCAFINLDIGTKQDKKGSILSDCQPLLIVTEEIIKNLHEIKTDVKLEIQTLTNPQNIAYVIYTSGTTGKPKGIQISHLALSSFLTSLIDFYQFKPAERMLHYSSVNFDAAIWEIFGALSSGMTIIPRPEQNYAGGKELSKFLLLQNINHCILSPLVFDTLDDTYIPSLKTLTLGGDVFPKKNISSWLSYCSIYNAYGPSEITVCATIAKIAESFTDGASCLGQVLPHLRTIIVDDDLQPVQKDQVGELLISGMSLTNGYLNNTEQNQKQFIMHNGERFYKTGDLVRKNSVGDLIYIGRKDRQVKVSSIRVELAEMENRVNQLDFVKRSFVADFEYNSKKNLCLYITIDSFCDFVEDRMREEVQNTLQKYYPPEVCPKHIFILKAFPLNTSGKIDIASLPQPSCDLSLIEISETSNIEEKFCCVLRKHISQKNLIVDQTFFELGGDSLNAILFIEDLDHIFSYQIRLFELFEKTIKNIFSEIKLS